MDHLCSITETENSLQVTNVILIYNICLNPSAAPRLVRGVKWKGFCLGYQ